MKKIKFCTLMLLIIALCLCAVPVAAANDNQLTEEQETQIRDDYAAWMNGLYPDEEEPWEPGDVGELEYYGDYNEYMVIKFNDWHGGETLCIQVEKHIAGYVFALSSPITVLCTYKDGEFIDLEVAYEDGLLTQWQIREIHLNYFYVRPESQGEWTNDNSIYVSIKPEYVGEVLQNVSEAFADLLDLKATYVTYKSTNGVYEDYMSLRLVLNKGGQDELDTAVKLLQNDKRVYSAKAYDDVPFETINTMHLEAPAYTVEVGDTITIKPEGEFKIYNTQYFFDFVEVDLADFDPEKEYTPDDFPQFDIASVKKLTFSWDSSLWLMLKEPGYFNVYKAVNAFASDPMIQTVYPGFKAESEEEPPPYYYTPWSISDTSIADFADKKPYYPGDNESNGLEYYPIENEDGGITIIGLKPGKVTVTYEYYGSITCEITVTETDITPETTTQANDNPPTGDSYPVGLTALGILSVASLMVLLKKKSFA